MRAVGFGFICIWAAAASAFAQDDFHGIRHLEMRVASGDIKVTGVEGDAAQVEVIKKRYDERCRLTLEQRGDLLFVELASKNLFTAICQADFKIKIPKSVSLKFKDGNGDIKVVGTSGPMTVETGSGQVDVNARLSAFDAKTGSGDVRVQGLEAPASVRTGSGHLRLVYDKLPAGGKLDIHSGSGNAEVLFPRHSKIRTSFSAGSGSVKNQLGENPKAHFTVSMKTGSGDLVVGRL